TRVAPMRECLLVYSRLLQAPVVGRRAFVTRVTVFVCRATATTETYTLSLHDALPIFLYHDVTELERAPTAADPGRRAARRARRRSEEHTSELQSPDHLVCRLLLERKKDLTIEQKRRARTQGNRQPEARSTHHSPNRAA